MCLKTIVITRVKMGVIISNDNSNNTTKDSNIFWI